MQELNTAVKNRPSCTIAGTDDADVASESKDRFKMPLLGKLCGFSSF